MNPPSYKRAARMAMGGGPKVLSNLTNISIFNPNVAINHPLLTSIPQELGKLANSLAVWAIEVDFFIHAHRTAYAPSSSASRSPTPLSCS